jgi:hypothetical protein
MMMTKIAFFFIVFVVASIILLQFLASFDMMSWVLICRGKMRIWGFSRL